MINRIIALFMDGVRYIREHPQLLFTLLLIVIIPLAFLYSANLFREAGRENQERLEKDRIGLLHDVFASLIIISNGDVDKIQKEINDISSLNPDITIFRVAKEIDDEIVPIAAIDKNVIGMPEANTDLYKLSYTQEDESLIVILSRDGSRFIQAARRIKVDGEDIFILTETSRADIDLLFAERERSAYISLFIVLFVVMMLVLRHVKLIDYGYLYRETKKANEMKDLFTNMIAHELRAPLTAMRGYASMIHENVELSDTVRAQATHIEDAAGRLVAVVSDLLDVARIQSGKMSVIIQPVDVSNVTVSVIDSLNSSAITKNIELTHTGTEVSHIAQSDDKRLHQAITNLVSNAIKYTSKGVIEISVEERKDRIELRVKDTGMGITSENQKKLFAPFYRVDSKDVSNITGTGLGMWITKQLIDLTGGSIGVESIKGVGTHVVITLPKFVD